MTGTYRLNSILLFIFLFLFLLPGLYGAGLAFENQAHYTPEYKKISLRPLLKKEQLTKDDYLLLFYQTGLAPCAVDEIRRAADSPLAAADRITRIQERFFATVETACGFNTPITMEEYIPSPEVPEAAFAPCHDGDILITFASHTIFWRNGHAALITDAAGGQTLEAVVLGSNSTYQKVTKWSRYPSFLLLRLKGITPDLAASVTATAKNRLYDIPYRLTAGLLGAPRAGEKPLSGTQCSHLVYSAFYLNGYDLDSDGGFIVTPKDLTESPYLEIVQIYGVSPSGYVSRIFY